MDLCLYLLFVGLIPADSLFFLCEEILFLLLPSFFYLPVVALFLKETLSFVDFVPVALFLKETLSCVGFVPVALLCFGKEILFVFFQPLVVPVFSSALLLALIPREELLEHFFFLFFFLFVFFSFQIHFVSLSGEQLEDAVCEFG